MNRRTQFQGDKITGVMDEGPAPTSRFRVLLVEDDLEMGDLETLILEHAGFDVRLVHNGCDALDALRTRRFHVILLDLMMPGMDGLTFLGERRRCRVAEATPVLCLSAAPTDMLAQAMRLGATECLQKPPDFDRLCERVAYHCGA